jgi:uncharacterized protein with HEPN domain
MSGVRDRSLLFDDMIAASTRLLELAPSVTGAGEPEQSVAEMVLWNLTMLGEAAKRVPEDVRTTFADVEWAAMARTRDVVVHHYEGVDWEVIRGILADYVPSLLPRLIEVRDRLRNAS